MLVSRRRFPRSLAAGRRMLSWSLVPSRPILARRFGTRRLSRFSARLRIRPIRGEAATKIAAVGLTRRGRNILTRSAATSAPVLSLILTAVRANVAILAATTAPTTTPTATTTTATFAPLSALTRALRIGLGRSGGRS